MRLILKVGRALHRKQTDLGQPFGITTAACADLAAFIEINFLVTQERPAHIIQNQEPIITYGRLK